jgi:hypothetical protein
MKDMRRKLFDERKRKERRELDGDDGEITVVRRLGKKTCKM